MTERNHFEELAARSAADLQARLVLTRWQELSERGRKLSAEPAALRSFQPEPEHPQSVGLHETASDAYTPEELVGLFTEEPQVIDWDGDNGGSECVALDELAEAC